MTTSTATSTITGGWCCRRAAARAAHAKQRAQRSAASRDAHKAQAEEAAPKQQISAAEAEIERITGIIAKIDTALALPDIFTRDPKQAAQLSQGPRQRGERAERAEEAWLEASAQVDEAAGVEITLGVVARLDPVFQKRRLCVRSSAGRECTDLLEAGHDSGEDMAQHSRGTNAPEKEYVVAG